MYTSWCRVKQSSIRLTIGKRFSFSNAQEGEKEHQTKEELWEQKVKMEALSDACQGTNFITFGSIEAQMRKISEQVTRDAQEKRKRAKPDF